MTDKYDVLAELEKMSAQVEALAQRQAASPMPLAELVETGIAEAEALLRVMLKAERKPYASDAELLDLWKTLVKGAPHWNTIRDNCRELIYYRNCLAAGREDALPAQPGRMVIHTLRHIVLYLRSHAEQQDAQGDHA
ncbi:hypothetical protein [Acidithiobacillus sulfuriphilus]|uniref:hypothetical protein n=1 Tax=Acidithiobacillus sulfuriphilus TaxID=1867749 RepID=UPI003F6209DA